MDIPVMGPQTTASAPEGSKTETLEKILKNVPTENARNLLRVILACDKFGGNIGVQPNEMQSCIEKYCQDMDANFEKEEEVMKDFEERLEETKFWYYMGEKLGEFDIRGAYKGCVAFQRLPWVWILQYMEAERRQPVVFAREKDRVAPSTPITTDFKMAFEKAKRSKRCELTRQIKPPIIPDMIRSRHDLLFMAKEHARTSLKTVPTLNELRRSIKWTELFTQLHNLEVQLVTVGSHDDFLVDLRRYRDLWFCPSIHTKTGTVLSTLADSKAIKINRCSPKKDRVEADFHRLVATGIRECENEEERLLFWRYMDLMQVVPRIICGTTD